MSDIHVRMDGPNNFSVYLDTLLIAGGNDERAVTLVAIAYLKVALQDLERREQSLCGPFVLKGE